MSASSIGQNAPVSPVSFTSIVRDRMTIAHSLHVQYSLQAQAQYIKLQSLFYKCVAENLPDRDEVLTKITDCFTKMLQNSLKENQNYQLALRSLSLILDQLPQQ